MARVLSFPFRLAPSGVPVKVEEGGDDYFAEAIASHLLTRRGDRPLVPAYGIPDPAFRAPDPADLSASLTLFGPDVDITGFQVNYPTDRTADVLVTFD